MTQHTVPVVCRACDGQREILDPELGRLIVCHICLGMGETRVNAVAPACEIQSHEAIEPMAQAGGS